MTVTPWSGNARERRNPLVGRPPRRGGRGYPDHRGQARVQVAVDDPGDVLNRPDPVCHGRVVLGENDDHVVAATTGKAADAVDTPAVGGTGQPAVLHVHYHPGGR